MSKVVLTGMRPTGALHLGHYVGVIKNVKKFIEEEYTTYLFLADWHAFNSYYNDVKRIQESCYEYVKGWLACGIDPEKAVIYKQSDIPEILMLNQVFLSLTQPGWADRSPSWKDQRLKPKKELDNLGFYTYPVLQAADIAIVNSNYVPVGEDQVAHIEIARDIVKKFNRFYKANLVVPEAKLTKIPKLLGTNGQKMSSSIGNVITLKESAKSLQKKVNKMVTDDQRNGIENPGNPDNCSVFDYHKIFSSSDMVNDINEGCRGAKLGCGECKQKLGAVLKEELLPISEKVEKITNEECDAVLRAGKENIDKVIKKNWKMIAQKMQFGAH
jgi:tryptophanyl-tRNA synthetase